MSSVHSMGRKKIADNPTRVRMRERLVAFRENAHMTQEAAAILAGISKDTLRGWEKGTRKAPDPVLLSQLLAVYGQTPDDVLLPARPSKADFRRAPAFILVPHPLVPVDAALRAHLEREVAAANERARSALSAPVPYQPGASR